LACCKIAVAQERTRDLTSTGLRRQHITGTLRPGTQAMFIDNIFTLFWTALAHYGLVASVFVITENQRPQSTLAWMLVLFFAPGIVLLIYLFFGRDGKAFSKRSKLLMQDLEANARPLLSPHRSWSR
jgi:hypothetical protein